MRSPLMYAARSGVARAQCSIRANKSKSSLPCKSSVKDFPGSMRNYPRAGYAISNADASPRGQVSSLIIKKRASCVNRKLFWKEAMRAFLENEADAAADECVVFERVVDDPAPIGEDAPALAEAHFEAAAKVAEAHG